MKIGLRNSLVKVFSVLLLLSSFSVFAMDAGMLEMLKTMKIDKEQVATMVDELQKMGRITPEQAIKAKKELNGLTDNDLDKYKNAAVDKIKSGDANRLINHDYTKGTPKLETPSVVELPNAPAQRKPASAPAAEDEAVKKETAIDFSKLGQ
jgi:hypothetical protein